MIQTGLWHEPHDPHEAVAAFAAAQPRGLAGASNVFIGTMRGTDPSDGTQPGIIRMWLEHYPRMTAAQLEDLAHAARRRHGLHAVLLWHRVGMAYPGEALLVIGTWAAHRKAVFVSCLEILETVKSDIALWKKEFLEDGSSRWVQGTAGVLPDAASRHASLRGET